VGVALAIVLFLASFWLTGFSWDWATVGIALIVLTWILFQWYRRYPRG
jgi:hypothetical protein